MKSSRVSSIDWEIDIYSRGKQLNNWPFSQVVSAIIRETTALQRHEVTILELGCGGGNNIWFMAEEGFEAAGIDISKSAITYARDRLEKRGLNAELVVGDMLTLPWPDDWFDIVVDRGAITQNNHDCVSKMLDEVLRVLKPSGVHLGFSLMGMNHPERLLGEEVDYHTYDNFSEGIFAEVGLTSFFTAEDITRLFGKFGSTEVIRHVKLGSDDRVLDEEYSVRALVQKK